MPKYTMFAVAFFLSFGAGLPAHAQMPAPKATTSGSIDAQAVDALTRRDLVREHLTNVLPPVRSREGMAAFMRAAEPGHPVHRLSHAAKNRFLQSLTFNENGLTGYRADDLLAELSASEIYRVLSVLGAQHTAPFMGKARVVDDLDRMTLQSFGFAGPLCDQQGPIGASTCSEDIDDAKCISPGTCQRNHIGYICRSTC